MFIDNFESVDFIGVPIRFTLQFDTALALVTNSSSCMFSLSGDGLDTVKEMVKAIHPYYEDEYRLYGGRNATRRELEFIFYKHYLAYVSPSGDTYGSYKYRKGKEYKDFKGIPPRKYFSNYFEYNNPNVRWWSPELSAVGRRVVREEMIKNKVYILESLHDNPKGEYREKLHDIAVGYHLG